MSVCRCITTVIAPLGIGLAASGALAQDIEITYLGAGTGATSISADGSVVVGNMINDGNYETFRWTQATGAVRLGRATIPVLGRGAGTPNVSDDGAKVSASVLTTDNAAITFGLWTDGLGWEVEDTIPMAPNNAVIDDSIASAWGLSGDGSTVTGFYWTDTAKAHPATWSPSGGCVPLENPNPGRSCRVNATNFDGTTCGGWSETNFGSWIPTVWVNGVATVLDPGDHGINEVKDVNDTGTIIAGEMYDPTRGHPVAALWTWDGAMWVPQLLGQLPGTATISGRSSVLGISDDGTVAVGSNQYQFHGLIDAFMWTPEGGLENLEDVVAAAGEAFPPGWDILDATSVSADGSTISVIGYNDLEGWGSFLVRFVPPCLADIDGNGTLNIDDIDAFVTGFLAGSLETADCDGNGTLNIDDIDCFVAAFLAGCP